MSDRPDWCTTALRLEELARDLGESDDVEETLQGVLRLATEFAPCDIASVSMRRLREIETTAASDDIAGRAHQLQVELDEGPCLEAEWDETGLNIVKDIADDRRWPRWSPEARRLGLGSLLAVRLFTSKGTVGALDLYSREQRDYGHDDLVVARVVAARASAAVSRSRQEENLWAAVDSRHVIGVAQGILVERYGISVDQAFGVLRRYSQESNQKLHVIAEGLIEGRKLPQA